MKYVKLRKVKVTNKDELAFFGNSVPESGELYQVVMNDNTHKWLVGSGAFWNFTKDDTNQELEVSFITVEAYEELKKNFPELEMLGRKPKIFEITEDNVEENTNGNTN